MHREDVVGRKKKFLNLLIDYRRAGCTDIYFMGDEERNKKICSQLMVVILLQLIINMSECYIELYMVSVCSFFFSIRNNLFTKMFPILIEIEHEMCFNGNIFIEINLPAGIFQRFSF